MIRVFLYIYNYSFRYPIISLIQSEKKLFIPHILESMFRSWNHAKTTTPLVSPSTRKTDTLWALPFGLAPFHCSCETHESKHHTNVSVSQFTLHSLIFERYLELQNICNLMWYYTLFGNSMVFTDSHPIGLKPGVNPDLRIAKAIEVEINQQNI